MTALTRHGMTGARVAALLGAGAGATTVHHKVSGGGGAVFVQTDGTAGNAGRRWTPRRARAGSPWRTPALAARRRGVHDAAGRVGGRRVVVPGQILGDPGEAGEPDVGQVGLLQVDVGGDEGEDDGKS